MIGETLFSDRALRRNLASLVVMSLAIAMLPAEPAGAADGSALSDKPIPMKTDEEMPRRVPPLIEIGDDFLGQGNIPAGFELPTGAVWIPALWVYGNTRTAFNYVDPGKGGNDIAEAVVRADLNFNLKLSGTERLFLQIQPFHTKNSFTGYTFEPDGEDFNNRLNVDLTALFFEGDLGEIFPNLDPDDRRALDIGFAVGRQDVFFQEGMMINDTIDSLALVRDTVIFPDVIDTRFSALWGWGNVNRDDNRKDRNAMLFGLFTETDLRTSTVDLDLAYVSADNGSGGDGFFAGLSSVQRIGAFNTSFRINRSEALDNESAAVSTGTLLFAEISTEPKGSHDVVYLNAFLGIDEYSSAARGETTGGPLGRVGLLFAATGLGRYPAALGNRADEAYGGAIGYQMFFNDDKTQFTTEIGGIRSTAPTSTIQDGIALGIGLQQKFLERYLFQIDGFLAHREVSESTAGIRTELQVQF